jgi:transcriptional regulator with XRE-family HTH domain
MSRKEFSSILEISIQNLADLEHGRSLPLPTRAKKIAEFLGEPEIYWIQLALQDQLEKQEIPFKVTLAV